MLDLKNNIYFFSQSLSNDGTYEYWCFRHNAAIYELLPPADPRIPAIQHHIDASMNRGKPWPLGSSEINFRVCLSGESVIAISPEIRDTSGRISPILMLFNPLGKNRRKAASTLLKASLIMERNLNNSGKVGIDSLARALNRPWICIYLRIVLIFLSRNRKK